MSNYNRITFKERVRIEAGIYAGKSFSQIAKELGRSTSSIVREVKQNRIVVKSPHTHGTGCINTSHCWKRNLCGEEDCPFLCRLCAKYRCAEYCIDFKQPSCEKTGKPPFVCDSCSEKNKKNCKYDKYYYLAEKAEANAKKTRSDSRKGIRLSQKELQTLDEILSPLILQGQPLSHICNVHRDEIGVCERSVYNYIDAGELTICNLDLRRKVRYRKRKKKSDEIKCNKFNYRKGRTYEDFKNYMEIHPDIPIVEMDTVRGSRRKEQVLLTIMFIQCSVMLMILIKDEDQDSVVGFFDWLTKKLGIRRFRRLFQVIVTDNGGCFKDALALEYTKSGAPRTKVFYCDPQASWQKPHIEKNHEFIRYVLPKGKSLKGYTQEDMTLIANHINSTTRPGLGYKSPYDLAVTEDMKKLLEVLNMSPVATDEICLTPKLLSK